VEHPNLYIVGFQKCGSSSLYALLCQHPEIEGSQPKETFFLSDKTYEHYDFANNIANPEANWEPYFPGGMGGRYLVEASVSHFYQRTALRFIQTLEDARVIFILRNPVERYVSTFKYYDQTGLNLPPGADLNQYYKLVLAKKCPKEAMNYALEHGRYSRFIPAWEEAMGTERVLVLGLKELIDQRQSVLRRLGHFLGLSFDLELDMPHENRSAGVRYKGLNRALVSTFGGRGLSQTALGKLYKRVNRRKISKPVHLPDELKAQLTEYYQSEFTHYGHLF